MKAFGCLKHVIFVLLAFVLVLPVHAQTNAGRILGTVHDGSGAAIRGAKITITDTARGVSRTTETDDSGDWTVPQLPAGTYKITVEAAGFQTTERLNVLLETAKDLDLDFVLKPGARTDTVMVTEEVPLLDTTNNTLGGTLSNQEINELPLNGRDFQNLVTLRPGVQRYPGGGFLSISSNGNRPEDNNFIVDGIDDNDPYYGTTVINAEGVQGTPATHLPIDAIQEFNAEENPPAEFGWKPGATVNIGLKAGTNDLHGTAYYFGRNNAFDARNYFNPNEGPTAGPQKALRLHQFGGSVGGPIVRNRLWYFAAYEGVRAQVGNSENLPTPVTVALAKDTANALSIPNAIAAVENAGLTPSPLSLSLLKYFPANTTDSALLQVGFPNKNREDNGLVKVDYHINVRQSLSFRYIVGDSLQTERDVPVLQPYWESQAKTRAQVLGVAWINSISDRLVNEARFGYNRFWQSILTVDGNVNPLTYGINTGVTTPVNFGFPEIAISGFNSLGGNHGWPLLTTPDQTIQFSDNVSYSRGKHAMKFGGEYRIGSTDNIRDRYGKGRFRFRGGYANSLPGCLNGSCFGLDSSENPIPSTPLEDFIAGAPAVGRLFIGNSERHVNLVAFGFFVQDDWRVNNHVTINAGLRWDINSVITERNDLLGNFDPTQGLLQVGQQIASPYKGNHHNFAPRLGIVWDPWGGKTVFRAGGSIIYEIPHISTFIGQNGVNNASTAGLNVIPTGAFGVTPGGGKIVASSNDFTGLNWSQAGPIFPQLSADCGATPCAILAVNQNLKTPYVATWNLNVQQAVTHNSSLSVSYVGNRGIKLYSVVDINQVDPNSPAEIACGHCEQAGRPYATKFPFLSNINYLSNDYTSIYHGLQASYTYHVAHGLSFLAGYTWSHSIDDASLNRAAQPQNSFNPKAERGSSDTDIRQRFTLALTYQLPSVKTVAQLLEGWQVTSIVTLQSGLPWGVIDGFANGNDVSLTGEYSDRWNFFGSPTDFSNSPQLGPDQGGIKYLPPAMAASTAACTAHASQTALLNYGCYVKGNSVLAPPDPGRFGTMGRNIFRGPGYRNWDFSILKNWKFYERVNMQFRAEFFNILNHPNFTNPYGVGGQLGNVDPSVPSTFGAATATPDVAAANPVIGSGGPRAIQFGLKFTF